LPVKVWSLADEFWVAAKTKKSAIKCFVKQGCEKEFCEAHVRALTNTELLDLTFHDNDDACLKTWKRRSSGKHEICKESVKTSKSRSFARELARRLKKGTKPPFLLATSDY
jgi:hypothetical protein